MSFETNQERADQNPRPQERASITQPNVPVPPTGDNQMATNAIRTETRKIRRRKNGTDEKFRSRRKDDSMMTPVNKNIGSDGGCIWLVL